MIYVLDFDDCVFDTAKLKALLVEEELDSLPRNPQLIEELKAKRPDFSLSTLVFKDALNFILNHPDQVIILSSAKSALQTDSASSEELDFQELKIAESGIKDLVLETYIVSDSKVEKLAELKERFGDLCFVDDKLEHVRDAHELEIKALLIKRSGHSHERGPDNFELTDFANLEEAVEEIVD